MEDLIVKQPELGQNIHGRVAWEGDALQQVLGKEKAGHVHGMGLLPTPKQVYGRTPRYLKNINMTTVDCSTSEYETDVWEEMAKLKEHIKRQDMIIQDMKNCEGHGKNEIAAVKKFLLCAFLFCAIRINILLKLISFVGKSPIR